MSLDKSDALFVDVIHTDAEEFGITKPIGHADFYPNEGTSPQPGCNNILTSGWYFYFAVDNRCFL